MYQFRKSCIAQYLYFPGSDFTTKQQNEPISIENVFEKAKCVVLNKHVAQRTEHQAGKQQEQTAKK